MCSTVVAKGQNGQSRALMLLFASTADVAVVVDIVDRCIFLYSICHSLFKNAYQHTDTETLNTVNRDDFWKMVIQRACAHERERVLCLSYEWNVRKKSGVCSPRIARIHVAMQATQCFLMSLRMLFIVDSSVFFCFCLICECVVCCCSAFGSWVSVHCQRDPALALEQTNHLFYAHSFITLFG